MFWLQQWVVTETLFFPIYFHFFYKKPPLPSRFHFFFELWWPLLTGVVSLWTRAAIATAGRFLSAFEKQEKKKLVRSPRPIRGQLFVLMPATCFGIPQRRFCSALSSCRLLFRTFHPFFYCFEYDHSNRRLTTLPSAASILPGHETFVLEPPGTFVEPFIHSFFRAFIPFWRILSPSSRAALTGTYGMSS